MTQDPFYGLHPEQFAKFKIQANRRGNSVRVPGTSIYIPADKEFKDSRKAAVRERHAALVPMKNTIKSAGMNWPKLKNHLNRTGMSVEEATRIHDNDPDNFLKNIGLL